MKKTNFKKAWITTQMLLFFIPIFVSIIMAPYTISYDKGYVETVNPRVLDGGSGDFNIEGAMEDLKDTEGAYYYKEWKLQHQELYYIYGALNGLTIGALLQIFNFMWLLIYSEKNGYGGEWHKE